MTDSAADSDERLPPVAFDLSALVADHWDSVYRLLHSLTGNTHDADDLAQETFLRALSHRTSFTPGTNLRAWLMRIASNAFFDERRKAKRAAREGLAAEPAAPPEPAAQKLETAEQYVRAKAALLNLSELTRLVFHLRVQEELSFREIAELANTTEQSARWHMHHARTKLLEMLENDYVPKRSG